MKYCYSDILVVLLGIWCFCSSLRMWKGWEYGLCSPGSFSKDILCGLLAHQAAWCLEARQCSPRALLLLCTYYRALKRKQYAFCPCQCPCLGMDHGQQSRRVLHFTLYVCNQQIGSSSKISNAYCDVFIFVSACRSLRLWDLLSFW